MSTGLNMLTSLSAPYVIPRYWMTSVESTMIHIPILTITSTLDLTDRRCLKLSVEVEAHPFFLVHY